MFFWGFIIGTAILVLQLSSLEAAAQVSLMILVFYFLVSTVLTWMVVQGGLLRVQAPFIRRSIWNIHLASELPDIRTWPF